MMLVLEVVTTALLLLAGATTAQKPINLDEASISSSSSVEENGPVLGILTHSGEDSSFSSLNAELDYKRNDIFGKDLDSEEQASDESNEDYEDEDDDLYYDDDEEDLYDDEDESLDEEEEESEIDGAERFKRKVIFRGGGGGGIYSRGSRRNNGRHGEDPYGRRRDNYGGGYGQDSWPYRRQDTPSYEPSPSSVSKPTRTDSALSKPTRTDSAPVYGTTRTSPSDTGSSRTSGSSSSTSNASGRNDGKRTKTERRETPKTKLSKNVKQEIAQYALQHGPQRASEHFEGRLGRRLRVKKIEKFVKRYQTKN